RNHNLLTRQLEQIDEMQRGETDPETLQQLFGLDHLVTRMRRDAESLLVLAGEDVPRRFRRPVSVHDVLQAAGVETGDFKRMDLARIDNAAVDGASASAVAHLLAELLENAGRFSPPTTRIQVEGRQREHGFTVSIMDQGIGMTPTELAEANERLANPAEFDRAPSAYLGLFVVGHLARRHGITVRLSHSPFDGIVAKVDLPSVILVDPTMLDDLSEQHEPAPVSAPVPHRRRQGCLRRRSRP
ncbi:MAG: ATP-binding protein, partial [Actinomycetota bacterium]|nr:ATP-binding protein [Actinomycetota bacterium]